LSENLTLRTAIVAVVIFIGLLFLMPNVVPKMPAWWPGFLPSDKIRLGLDLQGGMHLVLEVKVAQAVEASVERTAQELERRLKSEVRATRPTAIGGNQIAITVAGENDLAKLKDIIENQYSNDYEIASTKELDRGRSEVVLRLKAEAIADIEKQASAQALEVIRNRIDQFGVAEPEIVPQDGGRILVQLPGVKEPKRALALIGKTAQLEFRLVDDTVDAGSATMDSIPPGSQLLQMYRKDPVTGRTVKSPIVVRARRAMTGENITDARVRPDPDYPGNYLVLVAFNSRGAADFAEVTTKNVKRRLAIVLDGKVQSAPTIQEPITGGEARITGDFSLDEAKDLAVVLRSGALPAPIVVLEERTVGPSLGQDSINQGFLSMLVGFGVVFLFILIYYKASGVIANMALLANLVLILGALGLLGAMPEFQATLTMPGIAGIILTIGMAVDANVLIFERIREELRAGKTPAAAVEAGYARATMTILDANITTLIVALVLLQFGTGPVRGFAVTLSLGIASSLFTAITLTRVVFDWILRKYQPKKLSI